MQVVVKLFAQARDAIGADALTIELPEGAKVAQLRSAIAEKAPQLQPLTARSMIAVDQQYAHDETPLGENAEVALIPPVSGG